MLHSGRLTTFLANIRQDTKDKRSSLFKDGEKKFYDADSWSADGDTFVFFATVVEKFSEVYVNITTSYTIGKVVFYTGEKTLHVCRYRQRWRFEKIGEFLYEIASLSEIARPTSRVYTSHNCPVGAVTFVPMTSVLMTFESSFES